MGRGSALLSLSTVQAFPLLGMRCWGGDGYGTPETSLWLAAA